MFGTVECRPKPWTDIFTPNDKSIDRRGAVRTVPLRVLALGLGRTGTVSLRLALQHLGFSDTYHMLSASTENPPDCLLWAEALAAKFGPQDSKSPAVPWGRPEWDALLGHCSAVTDWPACFFAAELVAAYPEAKVILTTREPDAWFRSTRTTANWRAKEDSLLKLAAWLGDWGASMYEPMISRAWDAYYGGDFVRNGRDVFLQHNDLVRGLVPPGELLEFDVRQGWGPLCEFLGCPVPDIPFPHVNNADSFRQRCRRRDWCQLGNVFARWAIYLLFLSAATAFSIRLFAIFAA